MKRIFIVLAAGAIAAGCQSVPKRPLTAAEEQKWQAVRNTINGMGLEEPRRRRSDVDRTAVGASLAVLGNGFQQAAIAQQNAANTSNALRQQWALNRIQQTNFINGQIQSAQLSSLNTQLSIMNSRLRRY